jgi:hypothetical protein
MDIMKKQFMDNIKNINKIRATPFPIDAVFNFIFSMWLLYFEFYITASIYTIQTVLYETMIYSIQNEILNEDKNDN